MCNIYTLLKYCILSAIIIQSSLTNAQVGINTTTPEGILDVNSGTFGIVLPRIALTKTNLTTPVVNPNGGGLAIGTVVYNTAITSSGSNDVYPGVYVWTGSEWFNKFTMKEAEIYKQSSLMRTKSSDGYKDVPGLDNESFTAKYTGTYKMETSVNFGAGYVVDTSAGTDVALQEGNFKLTFNGTEYIIPASSYSGSGGTQYYDIWEQTSIIEYVDLTAGTTYNFSLEFDQLPSPGFVDNGNSGDGRGWVYSDLPCTVEFIYIEH